jgi:hypothetical protein
MAKNKPEYRVTQQDGESGKRRTVGRHTTGDAAAEARLAKRQQLPRGSSDAFTVAQIQHRGR